MREYEHHTDTVIRDIVPEHVLRKGAEGRPVQATASGQWLGQTACLCKLLSHGPRLESNNT